MNRTSSFEMQTANNKSTMSPILQCDISDKMTITSIKHKHIHKNHKFRRNKDEYNDRHTLETMHHETLKLNELNSSRKIASIIHETEDNIQEIFKLNALHDNTNTTKDNPYHHHRYPRSPHRKPSRHSSSYHGNSHNPYSKHSIHSIPKRSPPPPPVHGVFLGECKDRKRGKKRKRDTNSDTDDTVSSHSIHPRKRRKKSMDKSSASSSSSSSSSGSRSSSSSSSSSSNFSSSSSYHAKSKRNKKNSKGNYDDKDRTKHKKKKRDHSESDDNRKREKHKEKEKVETEEKTQCDLHLSPSPSLSISSLTNKQTTKRESASPSSYTSKSRSRSRSKNRCREGRKHSYRHKKDRDAVSPSFSGYNTDHTHSHSRSRSRSSHSSSSNSSSAETDDNDDEDDDRSVHKRDRKRKIIRDRYTKRSKRHYESHSTHNHDDNIRDTESDTCTSDSDTATSSSSSSSSSDSDNTEQSDMEQKKRDKKYRYSANRDKYKETKLPTTRNLLLSGRFDFKRMSEEDITREIKHRLETDKVQIEFWKYRVQFDGKWFDRHLDCISVSFETSQECQNNLSRFVQGFIDLGTIGYGINASLDQYKKRAKKYHEEHMKKREEMTQNVLGKDSHRMEVEVEHVHGEDIDRCEMSAVGRWYWLPLPTQPLHAFERPGIHDIEETHTQGNNDDDIIEPPNKKIKLTQKTISPICPDDLKSSKDILSLMGKIEKKGHGHGHTHGQKVIRRKESNTLEIDHGIVDIRMKPKKKAAIIQSKKMIEKHLHSLKSSAIKVKTSKHSKESKIKTEEINVHVKKEERTKKKKRKHCDIVLETSTSTASSMNIKKEGKKRMKTWRDYVHLYDGKETLAQLHFECMEQFKREIIEACVEEEYIRIIEGRKQKVVQHKFESSTESTPDNDVHIGVKKKVSEASSDESSEEHEGINKKKIRKSNDNDYEIKMNKLRDKLQTLSTTPTPISSNSRGKKGDDLATPQSPSNSQSQLQPKYPNIPVYTGTGSMNNSVNSTPTNSINTFPTNLPQISFNTQAVQVQVCAPNAHYTQPTTPIIKPLFSTRGDGTQLTVSQPITASYPSSQAPIPSQSSIYNAAAAAAQHAWYGHPTQSGSQYMPLYSTQCVGYPSYHNPHSLPSLSMNKSVSVYYPHHPQIIASQPSLTANNNNNNNNNNNINSKNFSINKIPNFDISAPKQIYCDTISSLSNTSNTSNISSSSHSITSITTDVKPVAVAVAVPVPVPIAIAMKHAFKKNELISKNGHWIIRKHVNGCARTDGFYSLAPSKQRRKHRHLAGTTATGTHKGKETLVFGENARNLRLHKRRVETYASQSHKMNNNILPFRHKNIQFGKSSIHSWGVFALEEINAEEMVIEYIGEYITEKYANLREKLYEVQGYDDYMFRVEDDLIIDATKKGNLARFINHSCDPNCSTRIIQINNIPRVVIYSARIIKAGEELTYDYKFPIEDDKIQCLCGSKNCRGTLN